MADVDNTPTETGKAAPRQYLSVWYRCCHVYGRMYRNAEESGYFGRCPRCGARVTASIGPHGTDRRVFKAM